MNLTNYLEQLKSRQNLVKPTSARNLLEEIAWRYISKFNWSNETLEKDYKFFWLASRKFWKSHTPAQFEKLLQWAAKKEVHVKGIANLLFRS